MDSALVRNVSILISLAAGLDKDKVDESLVATLFATKMSERHIRKLCPTHAGERGSFTFPSALDLPARIELTGVMPGWQVGGETFLITTNWAISNSPTY
jgi:hypothetical protein